MEVVAARAAAAAAVRLTITKEVAARQARGVIVSAKVAAAVEVAEEFAARAAAAAEVRYTIAEAVAARQARGVIVSAKVVAAVEMASALAKAAAAPNLPGVPRPQRAALRLTAKWGPWHQAARSRSGDRATPKRRPRGTGSAAASMGPGVMPPIPVTPGADHPVWYGATAKAVPIGAMPRPRPRDAQDGR